jgi:GDP-L-fucose synthase
MRNLNKDSKIYISGHKGMVGSAVVRIFKKNGYNNIIYKTSSALDLRNQLDVNQFFEAEKPEYVIDCAARVGGIMANNNYPYQFIMDNMLIQNNLIEASLKNNVEKFIFLGSSCIYPKMSPQPIKEDYLLTSTLEPTNEWYAIAKITGVKACEAIRKQYNKNYISLMPTNTYGFEDNFDLDTAHVLPAMIRKFHEAKINNHSPVFLWGSGKAMREFIFVDDLAEAILFAFENDIKEHLYNVGTGTDLTISALATLIQKIIGHTGEIIWDESKPDGTPRKLLDVSKIKNAGWKAKTNLEDGLALTYKWFIENQESYRKVHL